MRERNTVANLSGDDMEVTNMTKDTTLHNSSSSSSAEERRKLLHPKVPLDKVLEILKCHYCATDEDKEGCSVVKELDSYDDNNFLVIVRDTKYLLKVHNGVETDGYIHHGLCSDDTGIATDPTNEGDGASTGEDVIRLQNRIFRVLQHHEISSSIPVPPCGSPSQSQKDTNEAVLLCPHLPVCHGPPRTLAVRLLRWVEGRPLAELTDYPLHLLADAGMFLGRTCRALDALASDKGGRWYHTWDGRQTSDVRQFLSSVVDPSRRAMVERTIRRFETEVVPDASAFRMGILMSDFNDANILVDDSTTTATTRVCGVIDFGDTVYSWRVLDVTVAMAYAMLSWYGKSSGGRSLAAAAALLRGFTTVYPLQETEVKHLSALVSCRLACSTSVGAYSYQCDPSNEYLLFHAEPGWKALEFMDCPEHASVIDNLFRKAIDGIKESKGVEMVDCTDLDYTDAELLASASLDL